MEPRGIFLMVIFGSILMLLSGCGINFQMKPKPKAVIKSNDKGFSDTKKLYTPPNKYKEKEKPKIRRDNVETFDQNRPTV